MKNLDFLDIIFAVAFIGGMAMIGLVDLNPEQMGTIKEACLFAGGCLAGKKMPQILSSKSTTK